MRQTHLIPSLLIALSIIPVTLNGQSRTPAPKATPEVAAGSARHTLEPRAEPPAQLPVSRVALYKNGVGFFEHAGRVTGDQSVNIDFTTSQLDDVLQSLTAIDLNGGRIAGADYNSTQPLEQQLKALPLALDQNPSALDFYNAIRGARIEVRSGGVTITGRLLNIEEVTTPASNNQPASERRQVTVVGESGDVRTVELTPATEVHLLDAELHQDVTRYLELLASTRNQGLRHLTLKDNGTGTRDLRVSYISEVPVWKSTYRIIFTDRKAVNGSATAYTPQSAMLQGWSVVDNTTGADWINVQLSLIAGAPQSFIQPLSQPIYSQRPHIAIAQEAQLAPQTHQSGEMVQRAKATGGTTENTLYTSLPLSLNGGPRDPTAFQYLMPGATAGSSGIYGGTGQTNLNQNYVEGVPIDNINALGSGQAFAQAASASFAGDAQTAKFDDYFAYNLTEPVTIHKNESALVPIMQTHIDAERVTLWSRQQPVPLRALWVTNTSKLTLDRGSFSIIEDGNFGGEGLLEPIHPDEKRLLSYAVDQAVRVTLDPQSNTSRVTSVSASRGIVVLHNSQIAETTYVVRNAADESRIVVVEHPIRTGYTLAPDVLPAETTPSVDRFRVVTKPNETVRLHVTETEPGETRYQLSNSNDSQLTFILKQTGDNTAFEAALQPIFEARRHVADMQTELDKVDEHINTLHSDEERQRANVTALENSDKSSRERFVRDLNATEDQITSAQKDLTAAQANLQTANDDLEDKIESLQIDETL